MSYSKRRENISMALILPVILVLVAVSVVVAGRIIEMLASIVWHGWPVCR